MTVQKLGEPHITNYDPGNDGVILDDMSTNQWDPSTESWHKKHRYLVRTYEDKSAYISNGVKGSTIKEPDYPGLWYDERKIVSYTYHAMMLLDGVKWGGADISKKDFDRIEVNRFYKTKYVFGKVWILEEIND